MNGSTLHQQTSGRLPPLPTQANRSQRERLAPGIPRDHLLNQQPQSIETARNMGRRPAILITFTTGETHCL
jgi:hypothetical protein